MKHYKEEELFMFMDGDYDKASEAILKTHLEKCDKCSGLYNELYGLNKHLSQMPIGQPSMHFTSAILNKLYPDKQPFENLNYYISNYLMTLGTVVALLVFLVSIASLGFLDVAALQQIGLSHKTIGSLMALTEKLSAPVTNELLSNGLLGAATILLLVLLDQIALKPYFKKRREQKMTLSK